MHLIARVKNIILSPAKEWEVIRGEEITLGELYLHYALVLALASALAGFLGQAFFGFSMLHMHVKIPAGVALGRSIFQAVAGLISLVVTAYVVDYLAPRFEGERNMLASHKLVVFSATPGWLGGLLNIIPPLGILGALFSLYGLYLFYSGAPIIKKIPPEKAALFTLTITVVVFLIFFLLGFLLAPFHFRYMG